MARVRRPGAPTPLPPTRGPEGTRLAALLRARRFRIGAGAERVARNLAQHGGETAADAAAFVGLGRAPEDAPSVSLGEHAGTLGPRSFGFLNLVGGVAPLDAPLPSLPRRSALALVVPVREALPDLGPLVLARGLGLSWLVSVGDGDPAETLAFLNADAHTASLGVVLGAGASGAALRAVLGAKPAVVLGGDEVCRAVVQRAGATWARSLGEWLAHAQLLDAGLAPGAAVTVLVVGGGRAFVAGEVGAAGLDAEVRAIDDRDRAALDEAVAAAHDAGRPIVLVAGGPPPSPAVPDGVRLVQADLRHPEQLRALCAALAAPRVDAAPPRPPRAVDKPLVARVRAEVDAALSDHDAKRLLKAYGARVTRQAPTGTPTGAVKLAREIGLPLLLTVGADEHIANTLPDVRRLAGLLLQAASATNPSVMVRERFPDAPRARLRVTAEKGLGLMLRVGDACALLPLTRADTLALAAATPARRAADQRALAELLAKIAACAAGEDALLELELYVGAEPAVVKAEGALRRPPGARDAPAGAP